MNRGRFAGFAIAAAIMLLDGFDIVAMSLAAPHVMPQFGLSPGSMGVVFSALLVGLGLGSMLLGPLGDRFGRRPTVLGGAALLALTTLATIASDGVLEFAAWRFATGLALGLCLTNTTAMVAELSPPARRAATVALVSAGMPLGVVAAGLLAPWLVERGGWKLIFLAPGIAAALVALCAWAWLPETRAEQRSGEPNTAARGHLLSRLLQAPLRGRLIHFAAFFGTSAAAMYWFTNWLPVVLPQAGYETSVAAHYLSLAQGGSIAAGVGIGWLIDRGWVRSSFAVCYVVVLVALGLFLIFPPAHWAVLVLVAGGGIAGAHTAIVPLAAKGFPSDVLASAIGICVAATRIGAIGGSMAGGQLLEAGFTPAQFFAAIAIPVACCLLLAQWRGESAIKVRQ
ncbi:MAG: MFS transporter [Proteobacteria bacterium]|nr:MFS transporter [Pseudomonadota bacterium]